MSLNKVTQALSKSSSLSDGQIRAQTISVTLFMRLTTVVSCDEAKTVNFIAINGANGLIRELKHDIVLLCMVWYVSRICRLVITYGFMLKA